MRLTMPYPPHLPNFCNLGIMLRTVLAIEMMGIADAWLATDKWSAAWLHFLQLAPVLQGGLLLTLLMLCLTKSWLHRLNYPLGVLAVCGVALVATDLVTQGLSMLFIDHAMAMTWRIALNVTVMVLGILRYFTLRELALSPALTEARLQALQARIRPHFLFNSLNAVLSLVRTAPMQAERALQDLAELYRAMLADVRQLTPLAQEVELSRQYLELEFLRLGERLRVTWHIDNMPAHALVPQLLLQPLLENAVYHGIEPMPNGGEVVVNIFARSGELHLVVSNPCECTQAKTGGNHMALENIRHRLMLHFDMEAHVSKHVTEREYQVHVVLPYPKPSR